jgi:uncharacterized protein YndB with AHSA1/START domain
MPVKSVHKDPENLTMVLTADFDAPIERVWQVWADPRRLERWWGPPTYPATFVDHDLTPGGRSAYYMTGPEGDKHYGWWTVIAIEAPRTIEFEDGFADQDFNPNPEMPTTKTIVTLDGPANGPTVMTIETRFPSLEAMEQMVEMGMEEGLTMAVGQIDGLLAAG